MTYDEQIKVIEAAKEGKPILGRKKGSEDWEYCDPRCSYRDLGRFDKGLQFNFHNFEYKVLNTK